MPNIGEFEDFFANVKLLMFRNWRVDNSKKEKAELVTFEYSPKLCKGYQTEYLNLQNAGVNSLKKMRFFATVCSHVLIGNFMGTNDCNLYFFQTQQIY